jgi:hypothetical protein
MKKLDEETILKKLKNSEALTSGEFLADYLGIDPFFASHAVNAFLPGNNVSNLSLLFNDCLEDARKVCLCYKTDVIPQLRGLEYRRKIKHIRTNNKKILDAHINLISDQDQKILERYDKEMKRKKEIEPTLISIAEEIAGRMAKEYPKFFGSAFLSGSSSIKNNRHFVYYGSSNELRAVSDLNIVFLSYRYEISSEPLKPYFDEISRKRKIIVSTYNKIFRNSTTDRGIVRSGVPLRVKRA